MQIATIQHCYSCYTLMYRLVWSSGVVLHAPLQVRVWETSLRETISVYFRVQQDKAVIRLAM